MMGSAYTCLNLDQNLFSKKKKVLICGEKKPFLIYTKERFYFFLTINRILILTT